MDAKWMAETEGKTTEECWNKLFDQQERRENSKLKGTSVWLPNGDIFKHSSRLTWELPLLLKELKVKTFIDVGCSDAIWQSKVDWSGIDYTGLDIVERIIEENKVNYPGVDFKYSNLIFDPCPKADMIFIRNVLLHTSLKEVSRILENVKASGSKYLMASTQLNLKENKETCKIWAVRRNLEVEPFNFRAPFYIMNEMQYGNMAGVDNCNNFMGVWKIDTL